MTNQKTPQEVLKAMEEISSQPPLAETPAPLVAASNISPDGLRAARALLDWSRDKLKETAGVSVEAIKSIEGGFFKPKKETHDRRRRRPRLASAFWKRCAKTSIRRGRRF